jgi:hypothetical protein
LIFLFDADRKTNLPYQAVKCSWAVLNLLPGALQFLRLRVTPVMETGLANNVWTLEKFVGLPQTTKSVAA